MTPTHRTEKASPARRIAWRRLCVSARPGQVFDDGNVPLGVDRRDRAQADRFVRGVLRNLRLIDALLQRPGLFNPAHTPDPLLWVLRMAAWEKIYQAQSPDYAIGQQATSLARQAGGPRGARFVNAVVRRLLPSLPNSPKALKSDPLYLKCKPAVRWSVPDAVARALGDGYGPEAIEPVLCALCENESPTWLRVNRLRTDPAALAARLADEGVETIQDAPESDALRVTGGEKLPWSTAAWFDGQCTVQDIGAMLAARLLAPQPDMAVLDACAAPGGKTGHLHELMQDRGRLVAVEVQPDRRRELVRTLERLYGTDYGIEIPDISDLANLKGEAAFDRILVDAPCQALGLIRRHPEIRWDDRLKRQSAMTAIQRHVLDASARQLKPGGKLLWVTCSPTRAENEILIQAWLAENPLWEALNPMDLIPETWRSLAQLEESVLRTRPDRLACDGFAMCLLTRH